MSNFFNRFFPILILSLVVIIIIPIPPFLLDLLLTLNIGLSIFIFLQSLFTRNILEFSILPTLLLYTTMTRIILNVSSTRLILLEGKAGKLISAIGEFSIKGNYIVGIIIYIIITIIMMIVINKGAERISEVSARFMLDSLPGKQMAIEGELQSGLITQEMAKKRREEIQREMKFYGSMDGASKYVKGDAIASLIITIINIIGGILLGYFQHGMSIIDALRNFTILTVGDGLVNQVPALLVATSVATFITKENDNMMDTISLQFKQYPKTLKITSYIFFFLAITSILNIVPNMPSFLFIVFGVILYFLGNKFEKNKELEKLKEITEVEVDKQKVEEIQEDYLMVDKISIECGLGLIEYVYDSINNTINPILKEKIENLRNTIRDNYGVKLPYIHIVHNTNLPSDSFVIKIRNMPIFSYNIKLNCNFVIPYSENTEIEFGEKTFLQLLNVYGYWIYEKDINKVDEYGCLIYSVDDLIVLFLEEVVLSNIDKIINRQTIKEFKDIVEKYNKAIIEEINEKQITNDIIQKVVQNLLLEKISVKDFEYILESISDAVTLTNKKDADIITEFVRINLSESFVYSYLFDNKLNVLLIDNIKQDKILNFLNGQNVDDDINNIILTIVNKIKEYSNQKIVLVVKPELRLKFIRFLRDFKIRPVILSYNEIPKSVELNVVEEI